LKCFCAGFIITTCIFLKTVLGKTHNKYIYHENDSTTTTTDRSKVIDGDEFWHPAQLLRSLSLIASLARNALNKLHAHHARAGGMKNQVSDEEIRSVIDYAVPFARGHMATYVGSCASFFLLIVFYSFFFYKISHFLLI
jgi:hypothetical protein